MRTCWQGRTVDSSFHVLFHYPNVSPIYYSSCHFLFHFTIYPKMYESFSVCEHCLRRKGGPTLSLPESVAGSSPLSGTGFRTLMASDSRCVG